MSQILNQPLQLPCGAQLSNRFAKSAMSEDLAERGGNPGERLQNLYSAWASSGCGLLISGHVMIDRNHLSEAHNVVADEKSDQAALRSWAEAARAHGAEFWLQLNHPGRQIPKMLNKEPVAPSAVAMQSNKMLYAQPRALEAKEIEAIIGKFSAAAALVKEAGFSGVQIHSAHGYLSSQFLSPLTNRRDDEWGGTPEKRMRFLLEIYRGMREATGKEFPIGVKLNSADFQRGGFVEEESLEVIAALASEGVDLLEISGGNYERPAMVGKAPRQAESTRQREAYFLEFAEKARQRAPKLPLMLTGGFRTLKAMESAVSSGALDVIGLARPMAVEPDLPAKLLGGMSDRAVSVKTSYPIKGMEGFIDLVWHKMQLHRMANGLQPNPKLPRRKALVRTLRGG